MRQNSTKMGCVRDARNESWDSLHGFGQKSEKRPMRCNESPDSLHGLGRNKAKKCCVCNACNESVDSLHESGQKSEKCPMRCNESADREAEFPESACPKGLWAREIQMAARHCTDPFHPSAFSLQPSLSTPAPNSPWLPCLVRPAMRPGCVRSARREGMTG
jgi:hypothetical protein